MTNDNFGADDIWLASAELLRVCHVAQQMLNRYIVLHSDELERATSSDVDAVLERASVATAILELERAAGLEGAKQATDVG